LDRGSGPGLYQYRIGRHSRGIYANWDVY